MYWTFLSQPVPITWEKIQWVLLSLRSTSWQENCGKKPMERLSYTIVVVCQTKKSQSRIPQFLGEHNKRIKHTERLSWGGEYPGVLLWGWQTKNGAVCLPVHVRPELTGLFCMSALQSAVLFGIGFPSMKTGGSRSFPGLPTVSAGKWLSLDRV